MHFDLVVGNPPYNKGMDLDFIDLGYELSEQYTVMIVPAKWQTADANHRISSKMSYGTSVIKIYNATKGYDKEFRTFEKLSDDYIYKYHELTKAEIKKTKISRSKTAAGYMLTVSTPYRNGMDTYCLIKDKATDTIYSVEYKGSEDPYAVYKSIKVMK